MTETASRRWAGRSFEELESIYWDTIAPEREADGYDPSSDPPTHAWLRDHGFRGLIKALRRDHELTVREFFDELDVGQREAYWAFVTHAPTRDLLTDWIDGEFRRRKGRPESTIRSVRSRLKRFVMTYRDRHGTTALLDGLRDRDQEPEEIDRVLEVFEVLDDEVASDRAKYQYLSDVKQWYDFVREKGRADYNPAESISRRFDWDHEATDGDALSERHVRQLYRAADGLEERLIIAALCGWGLRTAEVAALNASQFVLDPADDTYPYLEFDEARKNGPGTVTLLTGTGVLTDRLASLSDEPDWTGYLFPSTASQTGHLSASTIRRRFATLAERADVRIDGQRPVPKMGRRFWYRTYSEAIEQVAQQLRDIAEEQGSRDPQVVVDNYLSSTERRKQRRTYMADRLAGLFE